MPAPERQAPGPCGRGHFAVSRGELDAAFGAGRVAVIAPDRLNPAVTHPDTGRFLATVGLPAVGDFLFAADDGLAGGLVPAVGRRPWLPELPGVDAGVGSWVVLGFFWDDVILLDGATGRVLVLVDGTSQVVPLNSGVGLFARFLTEVRRALPALTEGDEDEDDDVHEAAGARLLQELRGLDPAVFGARPGYWDGVVDAVVWGV
jgi:hypothetical protein